MQARMRACCPPPAGWRFDFYWSSRLLQGPDDATCERDAERHRFVIRVARGYSRGYTEELLCHEVAHALAWSDAPHVFARDHGTAWAQAYYHLRVAMRAAKYAEVYASFYRDRGA